MKASSIFPAPGVDGPALSDRIGIEMAFEQKTFAASCATPPPDRDDAAARNWGQRRVKAERLNLAHHETGQLALALGLRIAFALHHMGEEIEAGARRCAPAGLLGLIGAPLGWHDTGSACWQRPLAGGRKA